MDYYTTSSSTEDNITLNQVTHKHSNVSTQVNMACNMSAEGDLSLHFVNRPCGDWLSAMWHLVIVLLQVFSVSSALVIRSKCGVLPIKSVSPQYVDKTQLPFSHSFSSTAPNKEHMQIWHLFIFLEKCNWRKIWISYEMQDDFSGKRTIRKWSIDTASGFSVFSRNNIPGCRNDLSKSFNI